MSNTKFAIIGAGIGGLAAALALLREGAEVQVYEQASVLGEVGAGLTLSRGAISCCEHLGLGAALREVLAPVPHFAFLHYRTGETLPGPAPRAGVQGHDGHVYRPDLHAILTAAVRGFGADRIMLGKRLSAVEASPDGVTARFTDGTSASAGVLVGADGVRSAVRQAVFGEGPPEFTGRIAYRFMLPAEEAGDFALVGGSACLFVGRGQVFNRYLVSNGRLLNCVGLLHGAWAEEGWNCPAGVEELLAAYEGWHPSVRDVMARAPAGRLIKWGIFSRPPRDVWVQGRIVLLGDAAHPMQPFLGLGAAMAIEDGTILGREVAAQASIDAALAAYARARVPRAHAVTALSKLQGDLFDSTDPAQFPPPHAPSHDPAVGAFDPLAA
jgi:salicylate hydroxylase